MAELFPSLHASLARPALRVGERRMDHHELAAACAAHAEVLRARGFAPGDRIGVWTQPALETLVALIAHAATGLVSVPLDPKLGERERAHILADAAPRVCVAADAGAVAAYAPTIAIELRTPAAPLPHRSISGAPALVLYTSGSTGTPKGALVTDAGIASNLDALQDAWAWGADDVVVHALPVFHVHGLVLGLFGSIRRGGMLRWVPRFAPEELAAALADYPARGLLFAVPTMYHRLCELAERDPAVAGAMRAARLLVSGSAPLPASEHRRIERIAGQRPIERYGMTETLIICSTRHDGERPPGCVGPPLTGVELRLVDDARRPIEEDPLAMGEIAVRGPSVFAGYLSREDATREALDAEGWFYTGDVATRSSDGMIRIVGRRSTDIIKCGGYKVGAGEVEAALLEHAAVAEAAVVGEPDPDLGERIVAYVVARDTVTPDELSRHVAGLLSPHKRPRAVHLIAELPRNAMGKVVKAKLSSG